MNLVPCASGITSMKKNVKGSGKGYYYVIFDAETVVFNKKGKKIVSCPTEEEAVAYIREIEGRHTGRDDN